MLPEKWQETKEKILKNFEVIDQLKEKDEERQEEKEIIEFNGPLGKMRFEWLTRPKVIDKKTSYSRRIGSEVKVAYVYSPDEFIYNLKIYRWDEIVGDWQEVKAGGFI